MNTEEDLDKSLSAIFSKNNDADFDDDDADYEQDDDNENSDDDFVDADDLEHEQDEQLDDDNENSDDAQETQENAATETMDHYPKSWSKEMKEHFDKSSPELKDYILRREDEINRGFAKMDYDRHLGREYQGVLRPYLADLEAIGDLGGVNTIKSAMQAVSTLNSGTVDEKVNLILGTIQQHNLLPFLQNILMGNEQTPIEYQEFYNLQKQNMDLQNQMNRFMMEKEAIENHSIESEVDNFFTDEKNYPHAQSVINEISQILQAGLATSLPDAYQKAIYINPDVRSKIIAQDTSKNLKKQTTKAQTAKGKVISPKSGGTTPKQNMPIDDESDLDRELERILNRK